MVEEGHNLGCSWPSPGLKAVLSRVQTNPTTEARESQAQSWVFRLPAGISGQGGQDWDLLLTDVEMEASQERGRGRRRSGLWGGWDAGLASGDRPCGVRRRFGTKCAGCAQGISPSDLVRKARSKVFHLNCFTCMVCNKQLSTGEELYVIDENKFVCKDDYLSSSSLKEGSLNSGRSPRPSPAEPQHPPYFAPWLEAVRRLRALHSEVKARGGAVGGWRRGSAFAASLSAYLPLQLFPCLPPILVQAVLLLLLLLLQFGATPFPLSEFFQLLVISSCIVRTVIGVCRKERWERKVPGQEGVRTLLASSLPRARLPLSQALAEKC